MKDVVMCPTTFGIGGWHADIANPEVASISATTMRLNGMINLRFSSTRSSSYRKEFTLRLQVFVIVFVIPPTRSPPQEGNGNAMPPDREKSFMIHVLHSSGPRCVHP